MGFGFETYDSNGVKNFSTNDFAVVVLDVFNVTANSTGSKNYDATLASNVKVAQSQEMEDITSDNVTTFNQMSISVSFAGGIWTVSWSPGVTVTVARDVTLYVLGY